MALYRKYRPATFAEVVGQEHVTEPLSVALDAGRVNHAYLFSGPRGCGKTSSARILARSLNCVQGPTSTPCGVCDSCVGLAPGGAGTFDVTELDAASHGGVDDTRELRDQASFSPASSRYRIFIIDEAHMVTTAGFNALLKIVEEPPEHVVFVFATTEPEKVLPTIRSRTHHYPFRLLPPATMRTLLERICAQEGVTVEAPVYPLVIRAGGGSPRDSLSVLDQLLAGAGPDGVTYPRALSLLGVTDVALIDDAVDALGADDGAALFSTVDRLIDAGHDPRRFAVDLLGRLRDLILLRAVPDAGPRGLVDAPGDVLERMEAQAQHLGPATLTRYAEVVHAGLTEMRGATAPRLLLEVVCARLLLPSASDAESAVLQRLERVERRMSITPPEQETSARFQRASERSVPAASETPVPGSPPPGSATPTPPPPAPPRPAVPESATSRPAGPESETSAQSSPSAIPVAEASVSELAVPESATSEPQPVASPAQALRTASAETASAPQAVEATVEAPATGRPAATVSAESQTDGVAAGAPDGQPDAADVRRIWSEVRNEVRERSRTTEVMLSSATVRRVEGDTLVLSHDSAPLAKRLTESRNADVVSAALQAVLGVTWRVTCEGPGGGPVVQAPSTPPPVAAPKTYARRQQPTDDASAPPEPSPSEPPAPESTPPEPDDEESLLADAAHGTGEPIDRRDPHEAALELLKTELGAHPLS